MFKFLKDKLKGAIDKFTKKVEEEAQEQEIEQPIQTPKQEKEEKKEAKLKEKPKEQKKEITKKEIIQEEKVVVEEKKEEKHGFFDFLKKKKEDLPEKEEKKGIFQVIKEKVTTKTISPDQFDELFFDLELVLLENNVAVEVIEKIKKDLKMDLVNTPLKRSAIDEAIKEALKESLEDVLDTPKLDLISLVKKTKQEGRPYIILILGYNGSGKSITAAKLAKYFKKYQLKPILGAGDTFRAAGALQLSEYAKLVNVPTIKQETGADSCAVIFDTISSAKARNYDVVIADTAGRIHSNTDLMQELEKIVRVNKPDLKILIIDSLTGSDVVPQAKEFDKSIGVDALILTKVDAYERGGSILSAAYILRKPILFLGNGLGMDSLEEYDVKEILKNLGF